MLATAVIMCIIAIGKITHTDSVEHMPIKNYAYATRQNGSSVFFKECIKREVNT